MSKETVGDAARQRLTRCEEGHVYDAAAQAACPVCAVRPASADGAADPKPLPPKRDEPVPDPAWLVPALVAGGAIVTLLTILVFLRGGPSAPDDIAPKVATAEDASETSGLRPSGTQSESEQFAPPVRLPEPAKAERWRTVMVIGGRSFACVNEVQPDGRYRLGETCPPPFAGETGVTIVNSDGSWTSRSDAGRTDSGTIEAIDADHFIAHTRGGPVMWERAE